MRIFISFLLNPFNWYILLFLVVIVLAILKKERAALKVFYGTMILILITSTSFLPNAMIQSLEKDYRPIDLTTLPNDSSQIIIVLGGGFSDNMELPLTQRLPDVAMGRLIEGVRIHKSLPGSTLVVTGGAGKATVTQSEVMTAIAIEFGATKVAQLPDVKNTQSEAAALAAKFGTTTNPVVVTNAIHMKRAIFLFEAYGYTPYPAPTNFINKGGTNKYRFLWLPSTGNIDKFGTALKEYLGRIVGHFETRRKGVRSE